MSYTLAEAEANRLGAGPFGGVLLLVVERGSMMAVRDDRFARAVVGDNEEDDEGFGDVFLRCC